MNNIKNFSHFSKKLKFFVLFYRVTMHALKAAKPFWPTKFSSAFLLEFAHYSTSPLWSWDWRWPPVHWVVSEASRSSSHALSLVRYTLPLLFSQLRDAASETTTTFWFLSVPRISFILQCYNKKLSSDSVWNREFSSCIQVRHYFDFKMFLIR